MNLPNCACGMATRILAGEYDATCTGCRELPEYCDCTKVRVDHSPDETGGIPPELTELGYARRLVAKHGAELRYVVPWDQWMHWDGTRWAKDADGHVIRCIQDLTEQVIGGLREDPEPDKPSITAAKKAQSWSGTKGIMHQAGAMEGIAVLPEGLDAHPHLLNTQSGVMNLKTGEMMPHDPALMLTKITSAAYVPGARAPVFIRFLERVQPDEGMRQYIQRLLGHSLQGEVTVHMMPIFHGAGANGKSTLMDAVMHAVGDYADAGDPDLLRARTFDAHPTGIADLFSRRMVLLHESDAGIRLAEGTVKRLTGGDRLKARRMREDFWSFQPSHTFFLMTNHKPVVGGTDEGIWRRLKLIPFDVIVPAEERDEDLGDKLAGEADAILTWLVDGYLDWRANGFREPEAVTSATAAFRSESDPLGRFIADRCMLMAGARVGSTELFSAWEKWCQAEREEAGTPTALANSLKNRGYENRRGGSGIRWTGIGLYADEMAARSNR